MKTQTQQHLQEEGRVAGGNNLMRDIAAEFFWVTVTAIRHDYCARACVVPCVALQPICVVNGVYHQCFFFPARLRHQA
jgi:hypothetical protein